MNTYRVSLKLKSWGKIRHYDVDASRPGEAIRRALAGFPDSPQVDVSCQLYAKQITRDYADPRVRTVA